MLTRQNYQELGELAIRDFFDSRDDPQAIKIRPPVELRRFLAIHTNGDTLYQYEYKGETVYVLFREYDCVLTTDLEEVSR